MPSLPPATSAPQPWLTPPWLKALDNTLDGPGNPEDNRAKGFGRRQQASLKILPWLLLASGLATLVFGALPQIDLQVSTWVFRADATRFFLSQHPIGLFFHHDVMLALFALLGALGLAYLVGECRQKPLWGLTRRRVLFMTLAITLSAGLMTNAVFKDHWGRSRPRDVVAFGGAKEFTPAGIISTQCRKNCSFVSGESSFAFSLVCLPWLLVGVLRRRVGIGLAVILGIAVAVWRVLMGAHFLSDVVLAALYTLVIISLLSDLLFAYRPTTSPLPPQSPTS